MITLAIDSSSSKASVAISRDGQVVACQGDESAPSAEALPFLIDGVLAASACEWTDLSHVAVGIGPGSFTGLRVGVSSGLGIACARNLPIVGVSLFIAQLLPRISSRSDEVTALLPAYPGEVFCQRFVSSAEQLRSLSPIEVRDALDCARLSDSGERCIDLSMADPEQPIRDIAAWVALAAEAIVRGEVLCPVGAIISKRASAADIPILYGKGVNAKTIAERALTRPTVSG